MPVVDGLETIKNGARPGGPGEQVPIMAITAFDVYGMKEARSRLAATPTSANLSIWTTRSRAEGVGFSHLGFLFRLGDLSAYLCDPSAFLRV
jgi:hypothetical protein